MTDRLNPVFRTTGEVLLIGTMATYNSQAEASQGIPQQWRLFLVDHPALESSSNFYGRRLALATARFTTLPALHMEARKV